MDESLIVESLSPIERALLPAITQEFTDLATLASSASQDDVTALRAAGFLETKGLVELKTSQSQTVDLGVLGIHYAKTQLPERALLNILSQKKIISIGDIGALCSLNDNESKIALGTLKKKALVEVKEGKLYLNAGGSDISKKNFEELLLEKLPLALESLEPQDLLALDHLKKRKDIVVIEDQKTTQARLTKLGEKIAKQKLTDSLLESLTPKMIKQNSWKGKKFRRYDLTSPVPRIFGGRRHFVNQATEYAKSIWLEMGFKEMKGDMVVSGFWNFDALFTAQDHPVRDMQDTFFIKEVESDLPEKNLVKDVKKSHEGGVDGSTGWQETWREEDSKKVLLRTHTTCLSAKTMRQIKENKEFPAKYFALGKCFRNETVDWSHGFEFNQTEGIVVDEHANFRQLLGYLVEFFKKMGYEKIRIRPGYFPYTEPSLEIDAFHPTKKKWVELGGAGMFRPEMTIPLFGRHVPVLAWGPGFDRIIMEFFKITDLREMYKNDITKLRDMRFWMK